MLGRVVKLDRSKLSTAELEMIDVADHQRDYLHALAASADAIRLG